MKIRVVIDRKACQSIASCVAAAPDVFELDPEAKAVIRQAKGKPGQSNKEQVTYEWEGDEASLQKALAGAEICPYLAITVYNDTTGKQLFPRG